MEYVGKAGVGLCLSPSGVGRVSVAAVAAPVAETLGFPPCLLYALVTVRLVAPGGREFVQAQRNWDWHTHLKGLVRFLTMGTLTMAGLNRVLSELPWNG